MRHQTVPLAFGGVAYYLYSYLWTLWPYEWMSFDEGKHLVLETEWFNGCHAAGLAQYAETRANVTLAGDAGAAAAGGAELQALLARLP